jgi:hypothetical protein
VWGVTLRVVSVAGAAGFAEIALDYSIASPLAVACARVSYLFLLQFEFQVRAKYTGKLASRVTTKVEKMKATRCKRCFA